MQLHVAVEALRPIRRPGISIWVSNQDHVRVFAAGALEDGGALADLEPGERAEFSVELENRLSAGRYYLGCTVARGSAGLELLIHQERAADFISYGAELSGIVGVDYVASLTRDRAAEAVG
jgi:hypothetical protein